MNITISTDKAKLDIPLIHNFLSEDSYWAKKIPLEIVERGIENSLNFGVYDGEKQIGYARVVTDYASFAYMADVFILQAYRGNGFSKRLVQFILEYPTLQGLRRWMLGTADAHTLYQKYGFKELANPDRFLEIAKPKIYETQESV
jgi:GNAT superfamily N-acetyltransferase